MRNKKIAAALVLFAGFVTAAFLARLDWWGGLDLAATRTLQAVFPRYFDIPFSLFTLAGSSEMIGLVMAGIVGWVFWKYRKIFWGLGAIVLVYLVEIWGKFFLYHPSPPEEFFRYSLPFFFPSGGFIHTNYSFPSGHTSRAFFLAVVIIFLVKKKWAVIAGGLLAAIMLVSRVYLGEHWLSDAIGGAFLGSSAGLLATLLF
jgi:membrane-associated phospholipid phosphatase